MTLTNGCLLAFFGPRIPSADHQLQVLKQHPAEGGDRPLVDIDVQAHEENEPLVDHVVERKQVVVGAGDHGHFIAHERHHLVDEALNLRYPLLVFEGFEQIAHAHSERQPLLAGDRRVVVDPIKRRFHLLFENGLVVGADQDIVEVEPLSRVMKHARDVFEVHALVAFEEVLFHIEGLEDEGHMLFGVPLRRPEWVVARRNVGPHGVDNAKIRHPPGGFDRGKQFRKKLLVAFAVDEDDGDAASDVLFGDGLEQIRFASPCHPEGVRLHGPGLVRPVERLSEDVVSEQDRGMPARFFEVSLILPAGHMRDRPRPRGFHFADPGCAVAQDFPQEHQNQERINRHLDELRRAYMEPVPDNEIPDPKHAKDEHPGKKQRILFIGMAAIANFSLHGAPPLKARNPEVEESHGRASKEQQHRANDEQRMQIALSFGVSLLNRVQERPLQSLDEALVAGLPVSNPEPGSRFLGRDEFEFFHQSTAVALTA